MPETLTGLLILNLIFILLLWHYVLPREEPEIFSRDRHAYQYFIFWPGKKEISDNHLFGTRYERVYKKRLPGQPPISRQLSPMVLFNPEIKGKEFVMLIGGEIAVTQRFLDALTEKGATGYTTNPVKISFVKNSVRHELFPPKDREPKLKDEDGREWFQLIATSVLPSLHPLTKHVVKDNLSWDSVVVDSKFYYDENICEVAGDVNQTAEYFGSTADADSSERPQRYWVFSAGLKDLMIREFGFREMDFVPVRRVDKDGNVIDESKKENTASGGAETAGAETASQAGKV